jgi:hypothetical protein
VEGYQPKKGESAGSSLNAVNPGFFAALGIRLRAGREITARDDAGAPKAVVVNEAFAEHYCEGRNPVGLHLMFGGGNHPVLDREIVGVAADVRTEMRQPAKPALYTPTRSGNNRSGSCTMCVPPAPKPLWVRHSRRGPRRRPECAGCGIAADRRPHRRQYV